MKAMVITMMGITFRITKIDTNLRDDKKVNTFSICF